MHSRQWLGIDKLADKFGEGSLKLTTRQAFQLYGILKCNLKQTIKEINDTLLDTLAACGDVNRNVMSPANPFETELHGQALQVAQQIHDHLTPRTSAYAEIWLDGEKAGTIGEEEVEPIYGKTYLPGNLKSLLLYLHGTMWMYFPTASGLWGFLRETKWSVQCSCGRRSWYDPWQNSNLSTTCGCDRILHTRTGCAGS